jgi:hypothetical protein
MWRGELCRTEMYVARYSAGLNYQRRNAARYSI